MISHLSPLRELDSLTLVVLNHLHTLVLQNWSYSHLLPFFSIPTSNLFQLRLAPVDVYQSDDDASFRNLFHGRSCLANIVNGSGD